jgi:hypothetical protein
MGGRLLRGLGGLLLAEGALHRLEPFSLASAGVQFVLEGAGLFAAGVQRRRRGGDGGAGVEPVFPDQSTRPG